MLGRFRLLWEPSAKIFGRLRELRCGVDESRPSGDNRKVAFLQYVGLWRSLGARFHGMEEVIGSIPIRSTN
jgi:hypothetical protein